MFDGFLGGVPAPKDAKSERDETNTVEDKRSERAEDATGRQVEAEARSNEAATYEKWWNERRQRGRGRD